MDISVTDFKARCLDLIRKVEKSGKPVTIRRRGKTVARQMSDRERTALDRAAEAQ